MVPSVMKRGARPMAVEYRLSKSARAALEGNISGLQDFYYNGGLRDALHAISVERVKRADDSFKLAHAMLDAIAKPLEHAVQDDAEEDRLITLGLALSGARSSVGKGISQAAGLTLGFNAGDGRLTDDCSLRVLRRFCTTLFASSARALDMSERLPEFFVAARREPDGGYAAAIFDPHRGDIARVSLPGRGHDAVARPSRAECVIFARRPGNFAVVLSPDRLTQPVWFTTPETRHFYGHGAFSRDGRLLYTTENDIASGSGMIGVRDATDNYRHVAEFSAYGIGPHDIAVMPDGVTVVVANGGIETHPDSGRQTTQFGNDVSVLDLY